MLVRLENHRLGESSVPKGAGRVRPVGPPDGGFEHGTDVAAGACDDVIRMPEALEEILDDVAASSDP